MPACTSFVGPFGYGSKFSTMLAASQEAKIDICDDCLEDRRSRVTIINKVPVEPDTFESPWACQECGGITTRGICIACTSGGRFPSPKSKKGIPEK
jgi:hypothetical protein